MPQVTVILPHYKQRAYLMDAVQSIMNQTFQDWELIIYDDSSMKESIWIFRMMDIDKRIEVYQAERHRGQPYALNYMIEEEFDSEFVAFQDADDMSFPWRLKESIKYARLFNADIVYGDKVFLYPNGVQKYWASPGWEPKLFHKRVMGCWGSYMVKTNILKQCPFEGGYWNDHIAEAQWSKLTDGVFHVPMPFYIQRTFTSTYKHSRIPIYRKLKRKYKQRKINKRVKEIVDGY